MSSTKRGLGDSAQCALRNSVIRYSHVSLRNQTKQCGKFQTNTSYTNSLLEVTLVTHYLLKAIISEKVHKKCAYWRQQSQRITQLETMQSHYCSLGLVILVFVLAFRLALRHLQQLERADLHNDQSCFLKSSSGIDGTTVLQIKF